MLYYLIISWKFKTSNFKRRIPLKEKKNLSEELLQKRKRKNSSEEAP